LDEYQIGKYEVTNRQYAQCVKAGICRGLPDLGEEKALHPVVYVTWYDAKAFCEWVGGRLPTEAEWEKAASWNDETKTKSVYPWGDIIDCSFANYRGKDNGTADCVGDTTPVGRYESGKSPYGVYDMAGNVWEWVSSLYFPYPYDAKDGREEMRSGVQVLRGGSWYGDVYIVRSANRDAVIPSFTPYYVIGFRCARDSSP
jgi:formylglycine-generating enzyme required for sulfatase activity